MELEALDTEVQEYVLRIKIEAQNVINELTEKQREKDKEYLRLQLEFERVREEYQ
jgi:hypothetical protein